MHGRKPKFTETDQWLQEFLGFQFNGITFRVFLCILIVLIPSVLSHIPVILDGDILRGIVSGILGVIISVMGALLLSHFY